MLILTSPAKTLDLSKEWDEEFTNPTFTQEADELVASLKNMSLKKLKSTLEVSDKLAQLNYERFQVWGKDHNVSNSKPAIRMYYGDIYRELSPKEYSKDQKAYLQKTLRIITGLYGLLRPYDLIQPYRLEMKIKLNTKKGKDLYQFWGDKLTDLLNQEIRDYKHKLLVSLASNEYEAAVDLDKIESEVWDILFLQKKNGELKNVGIFSKKARGTMIQYCVENQIETIDNLKKFNADGYKFSNADNKTLVFVR
ncbi:peroxide stress protein YaaA [Candidatus Dojkabacteria bacterium]|uniref:UPF0246 protein KC909_00090 n=1 Tax=Candidatus Dojkabacteria bacterium TaxID=2099670 RepID=A0A955L4Y9_9BACT|nr:peroxide stress protein YaaA [Candidatus Dojkabacteria bacterium]